MAEDWPEFPRETFQHFVKTVFTEAAAERKTGSVRIYRGQANAAWSLMPRLARELDAAERRYRRRPTATGALQLEDDARIAFARAAHVHVDERYWRRDLPLVDQWALMAHYGASTRLLDWTTSPLVALYFAVREEPNSDGAVWMFDAGAYGAMRWGSAAAYHEEMAGAFKGSDDKRYRAQAELLYTKEPRTDTLYFVASTVQTDRMLAQQSAFTVTDSPRADHSDVVREFCRERDVRLHTQPLLRKITLPAASKIDMLDDLARANVTAAALFPGLDGLGRTSHDELWRAL